MKPMILILVASFATLSLQAQSPTIADIARREKARKAQAPAKSVWVIRTEDIRTKSDTGTTETPATPENAPAVQAAEVAAPDPVQQWLDETNQLRAKVRELSDQDTATQLQINSTTNQIFAPLTTQTARDQAQADLQVAQQKLQQIRSDLEKARGELQARETAGPPKKQTPDK